MMQRRIPRAAVFAALALAVATVARAADGKAGPLIERIQAVGAQGKGNAEAAKAWRELVRLGPAALFDILGAIADNDIPSANWLRPAADAIAEGELNAG